VPKGFFERFEHSRLQIEVPRIIIHKTDQPDVVVNFLDADGLAGEDLAKVNLFAAQTDAAATGDHNSFVVQGIIDVRQSLVEAGRGSKDLSGTLHAPSLVRAFLVEDLDEVLEAGLLLQEIPSSGFGGFLLQS